MKKKYLAYCLAMAMVLSVPAPVLAAEQVDFAVESEEEAESETEEAPEVVVDSETETEEVTDNIDVTTRGESENSDDDFVAAFSDGDDTVDFVGDEAETDGWIQSEKVEGLSFKYDSENQTFYMKSSIPVALPDNTQSGWTSEWRNKYGTELNNAKTVVIEGEITQIGEFNFDNGREGAYDSLERVVLSPSVTKISACAFSDVSTLRDINLNNVEEIGNAAFLRTALENVSFDSNQVVIDSNAFARCASLQSVVVKGIKSLGEDAFNECTALASFSCESNIDKIPNECFQKTALTAFDFKNVSGIGVNAFNESSLKYACYAGTKIKWDEMVPEPDWLGATVPADTIVHCKGDTVEAKDATCTEAGWKEAGVCEVCGEHYSYPTDENVIPALGHDFVSQVTKKATCTADGTLTYTCSRCGETKTETIKAAGHKWSSWKRTVAATVFKPEVQSRKCSTCNKSESKNVGKKLTPKATVNASTVTLKVKQSTSGLRVTGLAKGDSVKSWKSSNSKIFTVSGKSNGTCKITGKKSGTAKLQITLASGLKKTVKVKVQASAVKTTKITVSNRNVTVQKGKRVTLKPVVTPFTSRQTVTYTSSNKKIATVSSKGVVTGKKKGTVKITVKSGNKSIKVTVRVK